MRLVLDVNMHMQCSSEIYMYVYLGHHLYISSMIKQHPDHSSMPTVAGQVEGTPAILWVYVGRGICVYDRQLW